MNFKPPQPQPVNHFVAIRVPPAFCKVIGEAAEKEGISFEEQLLRFAFAGADAERMARPDKIRRQKTR